MNNKSPSKILIDDDSKNFSDLKGSEIKENWVPKSSNLDQLYDELVQMDHKQLVEHCMELKQNQQQNKSKSVERTRPSSVLRSSQNCCVYKSLTQTEKATENLEKKYKRVQKIANELTNKNTIYQNDVFKADKRIEAMESRFNSLVEDFQKYINTKENEISDKDRQIAELFQKNKDQASKEEHFIPLQIDTDDGNIALKIYSEIMEDYSIPQERDEIMLDTIEKYIYDKKQPNVAYMLWEAADFNNCNNIEKSWKLMKALLQDWYVPGKRQESEIIDNRNSFSFKETQLKESFEKEREIISKNWEILKEKVNEKDHEILELKDVIRLKTQEFELLKHKMKEDQFDKFSENQKVFSRRNELSSSPNSDSEVESVRKSSKYSQARSKENLIQPYGEHKKEVDELQRMIYQLQDENEQLRARIEARTQADHYSESNKNRNDRFESKKVGDNDGTVVIGVSQINLNNTVENDVSIKNCKIEMSPIEVRDRDISGWDEAILGVFDKSDKRISNPYKNNQRGSVRKLNFEENFDKENIKVDEVKSNKDLQKQSFDQISNLRNEIEIRDNMIDELKAKLEYYNKNYSSKDLLSPRFNEPDYSKNERIRNQRLTADKVFLELSKLLDNSIVIYDLFVDKFNQWIDINEKTDIHLELGSDSENRSNESLNKGDEIHLLHTLLSINKTATRVSENIKSLYKIIESSREPIMTSDSQIEKERKLLHVKSDHQLFLIKDIVQEVSKILEDSQGTKDEFDRIFNSISSMPQSKKEFNDYESAYSTQKEDYKKVNLCRQLMTDMNSYINHLEQLIHELIDRSSAIIENSDLIEKNYVKLLKIANGRSDQK